MFHENSQPHELSVLPKKEKKIFADFIRRALPKKDDTPLGKAKFASANILLRYLDDEYVAPLYPLDILR